MRHGQTVSESARSALGRGWRNGDNTVRTLGPCSATGKDGVGERELEILHAGLTCRALWNGVESGHHVRVGGRIATTAVRPGVVPSSGRR